MAILFEDWCTADGGTDLSGVVMLIPDGQQAAGTLTLATVPQPITVTAGAFSEEVTHGVYLASIELSAGADEVRISTDSATQRIHVADIDTPQRLRDLIDLGVVGVSPIAKLNAIVTAWIETNATPTDQLLSGLLEDPDSQAKAALDAAYGRVKTINGQEPDEDGNVVVSGGGGGSGSLTDDGTGLFTFSGGTLLTEDGSTGLFTIGA